MPGRADRVVDLYGEETVVAALTPLLSEERRARIEHVLDNRLTSLTVVLEDLYDPHNGAACIRSIEGFGLSDVHAVEPNRPLLAADAVAIGAEKWVSVYHHPDVATCAAALRERGFSLAAALPGEGATPADLDPARPWALWFGNEREGLSAEAVAACDRRFEIPMFGFTRSFNLSVSVALAVRELAATRRAALAAPGDLAPGERARLRARWYVLGVRAADEVIRRFVAERTR